MVWRLIQSIKVRRIVVGIGGTCRLESRKFTMMQYFDPGKNSNPIFYATLHPKKSNKALPSAAFTW